MGELATASDVDVVVELVGGSDGPALTLARETLSNARSFVTANKAMIAHHGAELAQLAESKNTALKFEAAVAGGIPVIQGLRDGAAANRIDRVYGILNGTCNFILSTMEKEGLDFTDVLSDAQAKGFAEADPSFDIDGIDAAHKLAILASLSFGSEIDFGGVEARGIRKDFGGRHRAGEGARLPDKANRACGNRRRKRCCGNLSAGSAMPCPLGASVGTCHGRD